MKLPEKRWTKKNLVRLYISGTRDYNVIIRFETNICFRFQKKIEPKPALVPLLLAFLHVICYSVDKLEMQFT